MKEIGRGDWRKWGKKWRKLRGKGKESEENGGGKGRKRGKSEEI